MFTHEKICLLTNGFSVYLVFLTHDLADVLGWTC